MMLLITLTICQRVASSVRFKLLTLTRVAQSVDTVCTILFVFTPIIFLLSFLSLLDCRYATDWPLALRLSIINYDDYAEKWGRVLLFMFYTACITVLAQIVTWWLSPYLPNGKKRSAATGGIPELKAILSGSTLNTWLSIRMFVAKFVGMLLTLSSGLSVGKEGPFVHMACIVGFQLVETLNAFKVSLMNVGFDMCAAHCT